jgi:NAD+ kinase
MKKPSNIGLFANLDKPDALPVARDVIARLADCGVNAVVEEALAVQLKCTGVPLEQALRESDIMLVFGGDGTLLGVARESCANPLPLLGVKVGNFGFLASTMKRELPEMLDLLVRGEYEVSVRNALSCSITDAGGAVIHKAIAANEVYLARASSGHLLDINMVINEVSTMHYRGDAIIISTPSGSTGHSLSAGGPIVVPDVEAIVITPVCPHTLAGRPLVARSDDCLSFSISEPPEEKIHAIIDGQNDFRIPSGGKLNIRGDEYRFMLIKSPWRKYFDVLRSKFFLGGSEPVAN